MVSIIYFVIFVLFLKVCNGIQCADDIQIQLSSAELTLTNIQNILNDLKYSPRMKCQVYIEFNPMTKIFTIKFGALWESPRLRSVENVYINIITSMILSNSKKPFNQTSVKTKMYLVCYYDDKCDQQLIIEYFNWLMKINYKNLELNIRPLLLGHGDKKNECIIGNRNEIQPCNKTVCSWYYSTDAKEGEGKCENNDPQILSSIDLTTEIRMFIKRKKPNEEESKPSRAIFKHRSSIKFSCQLNNCNNQETGEAIKEIIIEQYNFWSAHKMYQID